MNARATIESMGRGIADGINGKDAAAVARHYTDDASLFPPGAPRQDGRDAVQSFWQGAIDVGLTDVVLTTVAVEEFGDTATEEGTLTGTLAGAGGAPTALVGKYIVLWKKGDDGVWRLHRDIWNFDS